MCCSLRTIQFGGWRWLLWWHGRVTVQCSSHQEQFSVSQALTTDLQVTVTVRYWLTPSDFNFFCFVTIWHGERQWDWQSLNLNLDFEPINHNVIVIDRWAATSFFLTLRLCGKLLMVFQSPELFSILCTLPALVRHCHCKNLGAHSCSYRARKRYCSIAADTDCCGLLPLTAHWPFHFTVQWK